MSKIQLVIAREYLMRVKKKSFIILTILVPILMAVLMVAPTIVAKKAEKTMHVMVVDENEFFINRFQNSAKTTFSYRLGDIETIKKEALANNYDAVLYILKGTQSIKSNLYFIDSPSATLLPNLESQMNKLLFDKVLIDTFNIDPQKFTIIKDLTQSSIVPIKINKDGTEGESNYSIGKITGGVCGFLIYTFIVLFAGQVLRSVVEEKNNRIVEVLISTIKPMQLLIGKIIGVALVGLTQFAIWVVFTVIILFSVQLATPNLFQSDDQMVELQSTMIDASGETSLEMSDLLESDSIFKQIDDFFNISFVALILCFVFYFIMGYLIYAALYAAVGSVADNETDSQQFTLPITIPMLLTIVLLFPMAENPNGQLAVWMSMIPLTSPVAMMIRLPNGVPIGELILSISLTIAFFIFTVWIAAKIYRIGILMYGKKITYRDLFRWMFYK